MYYIEKVSRPGRKIWLLYFDCNLAFICVSSCSDPESFVRGGPNLIFLVDEGTKDPNTALTGSLNGPPAKRH